MTGALPVVFIVLGAIALPAYLIAIVVQHVPEAPPIDATPKDEPDLAPYSSPEWRLWDAQRRYMDGDIDVAELDKAVGYALREIDWSYQRHPNRRPASRAEGRYGRTDKAPF